MRARWPILVVLSLPVVAPHLGCMGRELGGSASDETDTTGTSGVVGTGTPTGVGSSGTGTTGAGVDTLDGGLGDFPPEESICPPTAEIVLCIPETVDDPTFCLCSRQSFGPGIGIVGEFDGQPGGDLLVRGADGVLVPWRSNGTSLEEAAPSELPLGAEDSTVSYVPGIGAAVYNFVTAGELRFGTYDIPSGVGDVSTIPLPDAFSMWGYGDFDDDGLVDIAMAVLEGDMDAQQVTLLTYSDAESEPVPGELFAVPTEPPIDGPSIWLSVCDFDRDGVDDLWIDVHNNAFGQVLWGSEAGLTYPGEPLTAASQCFEYPGLEAHQVIAENPYYFGEFRIIKQLSPRVFEPGPFVEAPVEFFDNTLAPIRLGTDVAVLGLNIDPASRSPQSLFGVTPLDSLDDVKPMRVEVLPVVQIELSGVLDVEGDGRQEVVASYATDQGEPTLYLFEIVED